MEKTIEWLSLDKGCGLKNLTVYIQIELMYSVSANIVHLSEIYVVNEVLLFDETVSLAVPTVCI